MNLQAHRAIPLLSLCLVAAVPSLPCARAADASAGNTNVAALPDPPRATQEDLRTAAEQFRQQLLALRGELKSAGVDAARLRVLDDVLAKIGTLTADEMEAVLQSLRTASSSSSTNAKRDNLATAYRGQQDILARMEALAADLQTERSLAQLRLQLGDMLQRQIANLRFTSALPGNEKDAARCDVATANQATLQANADILSAGLDRLASQLSAAEGATLRPRLKQAGAETLRPIAVRATDSTRARTWPAAIDSQGQLRDLLVALLGALAPTDPDSAVAEARERLDRIAAEEQAAKAETDPERKQAAQAAVADKAAAAALTLQPINAEAARKTAEAAKAAQTDPQKAEAALAQAQDLLKKQADTLAKNEATPPSPQQRLEQLQQLSTSVQQLRQQVTPPDASAAPQNAQTPANQALQASQAAQAAQAGKQAAALQQQALPLSPEAAQALGNASASLDTSAPDAKRQTQAAAQLAQADEAIQKQLAQAQADAARAAQLAQAQQLLDQAEKKAAEAGQSLQKAGTVGEATAALFEAQKSAEAAGSPAGGSAAPPLPGDIQKGIQSAQKALAEAASQAGQGKQTEAAAATKQAQAALSQAQSLLASSQAALRQGQGPAQGMQNGPSRFGPATPGTPPTVARSEALVGSGPDTSASALVVGKLKPKDRQAIAAMKGEKAPVDYAPQVSQYYKNIADEAP